MSINKTQAIDSLVGLFSNDTEFQGKLKKIINQVVDKKMSYQEAAEALSANPAIQKEVVQMFEKARACKFTPDIAAVLHPHFKAIKALQQMHY